MKTEFIFKEDKMGAVSKTNSKFFLLVIQVLPDSSMLVELLTFECFLKVLKACRASPALAEALGQP